MAKYIIRLFADLYPWPILYDSACDFCGAPYHDENVFISPLWAADEPSVEVNWSDGSTTNEDNVQKIACPECAARLRMDQAAETEDK